MASVSQHENIKKFESYIKHLYLYLNTEEKQALINISHFSSHINILRIVELIMKSNAMALYEITIKKDDGKPKKIQTMVVLEAFQGLISELLTGYMTTLDQLESRGERLKKEISMKLNEYRNIPEDNTEERTKKKTRLNETIQMKKVNDDTK